MDKYTKVGIPTKTFDLDQKKSIKVLFFLLGATALVIVLFASLLIFHSPKLKDASQNALAASSSNPLAPSKPYYGVNVDMSQLVPGSSNYYKNSNGQDYIDIAHSLGITLFRIDNITKGFNTGSLYATYTPDQWNEVLNKMQKNGIKAVILIEAISGDQNLFATEINQSYLNLVKQYIIDSNVGNNPDVIGIDLKNEPLLDDNNLSYLKQSRDIIKQKYPQMPVCVGGWKVASGRKDQNGKKIYRYHSPGDAPKLDAVVDFYCVHLYGFDIKNGHGQYPDPEARTARYLEAMSLYTNNKPILVEEFGASDGTTITDQQTLGSMQLQANAYNGVYQAINNAQNLDVIGSTAYLFGQRGVSADSWAIMSKDGNTLNPAAYVLQKYATGTSSVSYSLLSSSSPQPHIFKKETNHQTQTVKVGDPVGLILKLPSSKKYIATLSPNSLVNVTQPLAYNGSHSAYSMVFQTQKVGTVVVSISDNPNCSAGNVGCSDVYTLTITIQ